MSQPRLSQRLSALEDSLGLALFLRERRGIRLTAKGQELRAALSSPLGKAAQAFEAFRAQPSQRDVVILSDIAFASFLLLPNFAGLTSACARARVSVLTAQLPQARNHPNADIMISMEPAAALGPEAVMLFRERVSAVCSPNFKDSHGPINHPDDLRRVALIDLATSEEAPWLSWAQWLGSSALDAAQERIVFTSYDHVVSAARAGLGVALGWEGLLDIDSPTSGLTRALPISRDSALCYVLRLLPGRKTPRSIEVFDWLAAEFCQPDAHAPQLAKDAQ